MRVELARGKATPNDKKKKPKKKMSGKCSFFFAWKPDLGLSFIFNIYNTNSKVKISPFSQDDKVCFPVKKIL